MDFFINFTSYLGSLNTYVLWLIIVLFCFSSILIFLKLFGYVGLFVYSALAVIIGNIQVLKTVDFFYSPNPETLYNVIMIYIFGTYVLRICIAFIDTPFIYLSKIFLPNK